jgi:hypothetical protein
MWRAATEETFRQPTALRFERHGSSRLYTSIQAIVRQPTIEGTESNDPDMTEAIQRAMGQLPEYYESKVPLPTEKPQAKIATPTICNRDTSSTRFSLTQSCRWFAHACPVHWTSKAAKGRMKGIGIQKVAFEDLDGLVLHGYFPPRYIPLPLEWPRVRDVGNKAGYYKTVETISGRRRSLKALDQNERDPVWSGGRQATSITIQIELTKMLRPQSIQVIRPLHDRRPESCVYTRFEPAHDSTTSPPSHPQPMPPQNPPRTATTLSPANPVPSNHSSASETCPPPPAPSSHAQR